MSIFRHLRVLNAPPEAVFGAFEDPALLARWWGPEGFRNTFEQNLDRLAEVVAWASSKV
jgi:uncharacterized protein YndB with AHSA1/START domain